MMMTKMTTQIKVSVWPLAILCLIILVKSGYEFWVKYSCYVEIKGEKEKSIPYVSVKYAKLRQSLIS